MSAKALLDECDQPSKDMITNALSGNLCRCAGYVQIVDAVEEAALIKSKDAEDQAVNR